ncbi:flavin reductase family protein [Pandoraea sp. NPDC087047]|uniref:flavin reductase family protein n=1 Tax=Pandoraea sp. NPDC087047 TaxID=3364390 RepID=UPI00381A0553
MTERQPVELPKAYRLLNHGPTVLVGSAHAGRRNVMAAAWSMPLDFSPPKVAIVIDRNTLTRELVEGSGEFSLNVPARAIARETLVVGSVSGRDTDKFAESSGVRAFAGSHIAAPLIEGCVAWLECRVIPEPHNQDRYDLFLGEVVAAWADPRVFRDGHWHFAPDTPDALRSLHYIAGGHFFETGEAFEVEPDTAPGTPSDVSL